MELPRFLLADNAALEDAFVLHTEYPRFLLNVNTDEVEWYDDVEEEDGIENTVKDLIEEAFEFFDNEIKAYEDDDFDD